MDAENDRKRKTVQIKLKEHGDLSAKSLTFDVSIPDDDDSAKSDLEYLVEAVKKKKPRMAEVLEKSELTFQIESETFKGDYVDIGDSSPVKHLSKLLCVYERPKVPTELTSKQQTAQHPDDDANNSSGTTEPQENNIPKGTVP